jgi:hypothetical protein
MPHRRYGTECIPNLLMMAMHLVNVTKNLKPSGWKWCSAIQKVL